MAGNKEKAKAFAKKLRADLEAKKARGLKAAQIYLVGEIKQTLNVPAPKKMFRRADGSVGYRATTPAQLGAPPRKLSGDLQKGVSGTVEDDQIIINVMAKAYPSKRHPQGFNYAKYHEKVNPAQLGSGKHKYVEPTIDRCLKRMMAIIKEKMSE